MGTVQPAVAIIEYRIEIYNSVSNIYYNGLFSIRSEWSELWDGHHNWSVIELVGYNKYKIGCSRAGSPTAISTRRAMISIHPVDPQPTIP